MPQRQQRQLSPVHSTPLATALEDMRRDLDECTRKVQDFGHDLDISIRRIGTMQAEIDRLRALLKCR
jgi:hypothetical protein